MAQPTEIEKKSLETHVELCAQRYLFLEQKLESLENKVTTMEGVIHEIHDAVFDLKDKRNNQLINWGIGIIVTLGAIIGYLLKTFVIN
jgi:hypothetical protein